MRAFRSSPRCLGCFGVALRREASLPRGLSTLAGTLAALLLVVYGCRLAFLSTHNPVLVVSAALAGFVASPAWYVWLASAFARGYSTAAATVP